jgi:hypothetical protein
MASRRKSVQQESQTGQPQCAGNQRQYSADNPACERVFHSRVVLRFRTVWGGRLFSDIPIAAPPRTVIGHCTSAGLANEKIENEKGK